MGQGRKGEGVVVVHAAAHTARTGKRIVAFDCCIRSGVQFYARTCGGLQGRDREHGLVRLRARRLRGGPEEPDCARQTAWMRHCDAEGRGEGFEVHVKLRALGGHTFQRVVASKDAGLRHPAGRDRAPGTCCRRLRASLLCRTPYNASVRRSSRPAASPPASLPPSPGTRRSCTA